MKHNIEYYDIRQATTICGYDTTAMIDYLCRSELIHPVAENGRGRGRKRLFSFKDMLILKLYRKLLDAGVSVKRLKKALEESKEFSSLIANRTEVKFRGGEANFLLTDGKEVYLSDKRGRLIQVGTDGQFVFSFMVSLQDLHTELAKATLQLPVYRQRKYDDGYYLDKKSHAL